MHRAVEWHGKNMGLPLSWKPVQGNGRGDRGPIAPRAFPHRRWTNGMIRLHGIDVPRLAWGRMRRTAACGVLACALAVALASCGGGDTESAVQSPGKTESGKTKVLDA